MQCPVMSANGFHNNRGHLVPCSANKPYDQKSFQKFKSGTFGKINLDGFKGH
jgi:hypothetical protein